MLKYGNLNDLTDEELVQGAQTGDREAENLLAERYFYIVRAAARSYYLTGGDPEDLIQEGMLGLLSAIREYDPERGSFSAFAGRCVRNRIISAARADLRIKNQPLRGYLPLDAPEASEKEADAEGERDPAQQLAEHESYLELLTQFRSVLSSLENKVLGMYLEGLTTAEISDSLSKPKKSIENAIARIRRKLGEKYGNNS